MASKTARVIKRSAELIHSDSDLAQKMEPAAPAPEAGPSNTELVENTHSENGASPVLDGDLHSPERANVNAMREALETQAEMEVGKPVADKQEEIKTEGNSMQIDAQPGKQIIINIASEEDPITSGMSDIGGAKPSFESWDYPAKKAALLNPKTARFLTIEECKQAGREYLHMIRTASVRVSQGQDADGFHMIISMNGREYILRGEDADAFRREYAAIPKPDTKVNALVEKYLWKLQPYPIQIGVSPKEQPKKPSADIAYNPEEEAQFWQTKKQPAQPGAPKKPGVRDWLRSKLHASSVKEAALKTADYEGWTNWSTWHVNLLIDNTETTYNSKRRLCANALKKGMKIDQLAAQFSRLFRKQYKETKDFYDNNAADSRDARGAYERKQLEGQKPNADYTDEAGKQQYLKDVVDNLFYGIGGQSGWEEPMEEVNWQEIAEHALENERDEQGEDAPVAESSSPFTEGDMKELKSMGIQGSKEDTMNKKNADTVMPELAPVTTPQSPMTGVDDPMLVQRVVDDLFPGREFAELTTGQMRDAIAIARKHKQMTASKQAGDGATKSEQDIEKEAGFNFFFPGQVLKEFYPEIQHEIVDYPNANNSPMGLEAPEMVGDGGHDIEGMLDGALDNMSIVEAIQLPSDVGELEEMSLAASDDKTAYVSTSPAGAMGIGRDGKSQVLEGVPLRKENDIRGPMFTDEFYGQYEGINGKSLAIASLNSKTAAGTEGEQFSMFLKKVTGEIAATMIAAFKVTSRPLLDQVPGVGEVQLAHVEQPQGMSAFNMVNTGSRVKYLMDKLNDSDIQDAINDAWAQAAVWHDGGKGGYVYEVFVRMESIDTDSMIAKYKFVAGTRE